MVHGTHFAESTILVEVYTPNQIEFEAQFAKQRGLIQKKP